MSGADAEQGRRGDVCGTAGTPPPTGGLDMGYKARDGPGKGTAARAGHAPPLRKKAAFFTNRKPCGKQMPRPLGRAGIKSEKAGFRLKNRLIVIFEVKSGFFPPLWGSRGTGPLGRGPRLAGSRLPSGLRRTAFAVAGSACIWRSPVSLRSTVAPRAKPRITSNQRDFSRFLFWSQKSTKLTASCRILSAPRRLRPCGCRCAAAPSRGPGRPGRGCRRD